MKTEKEWLECFELNLKSDIRRIDSIQRKEMIFWELSWINKRLKELKQSTEGKTEQ